MQPLARKLQFQYEIQQYQEDCVGNIVGIFDALRGGESLADALRHHAEKKQYRFPVTDSHNIDVMMETGTGKTFTFIKTIFELNRNFGYKKFIILIPSVPIREGTKANLEDTREYFRSYYANAREKQIETYVYEGGNISEVISFINSSSLSALVLTPSSFNSGNNILNLPLQREMNSPELFTDSAAPPKTYLECLKRLKPIVVMDEPHRFEGDAFKNYFEGFTNNFIRFGATFPSKKDSLGLSNVAYVLDSISSFRQNLVKKIVVYTQGIAEETHTLLGIANKKAIIETLVNGTTVRRESGIGGVFNGKNIRKVNAAELVLADGTVVRKDYALSDDALRAMIAETVRIHFQKEKDLFVRNIKALTLFFMQADKSLYRDGDNPKIKTIFEEEYLKQRDEIIKGLTADDPYLEYLGKDFHEDGHLAVHKGYFSGDKGSNADEKIKQGVDEILRDKKRLLSFASPTRFIFSIWALQEGWDNPNVFTICKLSNQGSEISKLQQIGRGLRICVDQNLQRQTMKFLNDDQELFWKINNLDVVVSSQERGFVEGIQSEILKNSFLVPETFSDQELKAALKKNGNFDDVQTRKLFRTMEDGGLIVFKTTIDGMDVFEKAQDFGVLLAALDLPEEQREMLKDIFGGSVKDYIKEAEDSKPKKNLYIKPGALREFRELWDAISRHATFTLENPTDAEGLQLVKNIAEEISGLDIARRQLETVRGELDNKNLGTESAITKTTTSSRDIDARANIPEMVQTVSVQSRTPLRFVANIFNAVCTEFKRETIHHNPAQAQREIVRIIEKNLIAQLKTNISYHGMDTAARADVFHEDHTGTYLKPGATGKFQKPQPDAFSLRQKWIFEEVYEYDSDFETGIILEDEDQPEIEIFAKLPQLKISTPVGDYNPDFCYAIKRKDGARLFLVAEAKGYDTQADIPPDEMAKINFAEKYFEALQRHFRGSGIEISYKKRINKTQLSAFIKDLL